EIHEDALAPGERVLIVDDVIATGGTARAVGELAEALGARVSAFAFLVELSFLNGREKLGQHEVRSLIRYSARRVDSRRATVLRCHVRAPDSCAPVAQQDRATVS